MVYHRITVAGQAVADEIAALKAQRVRFSTHTPGHFDSESLCAFQRLMSDRGYLEAEIVESNYGFSVRYASGLQGFGLIASARNRETDGTYDGAVAVATRWQAADPARRYVTAPAKDAV